jgi:uncharacterized secreted protein with C-terminal beta-propeller domain
MSYLRAITVGAALLVAAAAAGPAGAAGGLVSFAGCPALRGYAEANAQPYIAAYGGLSTGVVTPGVAGTTLTPAAAAASPTTSSQAPQEGVDYSGTNDQEAGVDEPDIVKTNGTTLFTIENNELEAIDVAGGSPRLLDTLTLNTGWSSELLLYGTHLLVLSRGGSWLEPLPAEPTQIAFPPEPTTSTLTEIDVSDPSQLAVIGTLRLDGEYLDARMVGSSVRVVTSNAFPLERFYPLPALPAATPGTAAAQARARRLVSSASAGDWLPTYQLGNGPTRTLVPCRDVYRPPAFAGLGVVTILTIDLAQGLRPLDAIAVMADGGIVYASPTTLYLATEAWAERPTPFAPELARPGASTQIDAFEITNPDATSFVGSGNVPGYLLDQWSMSEYQGVLRVVSTDTPAWWGNGPASQTYLTTLEPQQGTLVQLGQVGGLGAGERVYAARLLGDIGYITTFRQVDPLYTIDLTNPAAPRVLGQLDLPGTSTYLQPIGSDLLLAVGEDIDPTTNEPTGTRVSLFDVADPTTPTELSSVDLGQGFSAVASDSHAFLYWPPTGLVVVPFGQEAVALQVSGENLSQLGRIVQSQVASSTLPQIDRALVVDDALLTVSSAGVASDTLPGLASVGFAAFPSPPPTPLPVPLPGGPVPLPEPVAPVAPAAGAAGLATGR